jgi:hypothetical protein
MWSNEGVSRSRTDEQILAIREKRPGIRNGGAGDLLS